MKKLEKFSAKALSRTDMAKIKGGITCEQAYVYCHPDCSDFSKYYSVFAACVNSYHIQGCSPLGGWGEICGFD